MQHNSLAADYAQRRAGWQLLRTRNLDGEEEHLWYRTEATGQAALCQIVPGNHTLIDDEGYETSVDGFMEASLQPADQLLTAELLVLAAEEPLRQSWIAAVQARPVNKRAGTSKRHRKR